MTCFKHMIGLAWLLAAAAPAVAQTQTPTVVVNTDQLPDGSGVNNQKNVALAAATLLRDIVTSDRFKQLVTSTGPDGFDFGATNFRQRNGKVVAATKPQIWKIVSDGIERSQASYPAPYTIQAADGDGRITMIMEPAPKPKGVVGSTALGSSRIHTATWFMAQVAKKNDSVSLARHLMHEWMHSAGFFHAGNGPNQNDVAYRMGDLVRRLANTGTAEGGLRDQLLAKQMVTVEGATVNLAYYLNEDSLAAYWLDESDDDVEGFEEIIRP